MKIYKYHINSGMNKILSYRGAKVLSAGLDPAGVLSIWVLVDINEQEAGLTVSCVGTGWDAPKNSRFVGTVQQDIYMWHVFQWEG